jgi:hypothetical protein
MDVTDIFLHLLLLLPHWKYSWSNNYTIPKVLSKELTSLSITSYFILTHHVCLAFSFLLLTNEILFAFRITPEKLQDRYIQAYFVNKLHMYRTRLFIK